jgi:hypothetical protein
MKAIVFFFILMIVLAVSSPAQGISIGSGTTFSLGGATLLLPNNWSNAGAFTAGTGTISFNGSGGSQIITCVSPEVFHNVTVNKASGGVVLNNSITVNGNLTITSGNINLNGDTLLLGTSATLVETPGNTVKGTSGVIMTTQTLGANPGNVAGLGADISGSPALGVTTVVRGHSPDTVGTSRSICRYYKITPGNNSGLNATVTFTYDQSELNDLTESTLEVFNSLNNGEEWISVSGSLDTLNNTVRISGIGSFTMWSFFSSSNPPVGVDQKEKTPEIPGMYALSQNYPNPFNPSTSISFDLPKRSLVRLRIFEVTGREVATLVNADLAAGTYTKTWDASSYPSGVYFYRLDTQPATGGEVKPFTLTKKLLLVK